MSAGAGVLVHELYSAELIKTGGLFRMVQVWVNLPAGLKLTSPKYQLIKTNEMPVIKLKGGAVRERVIAGSLDGEVGPVETFTPINIWDLALNEETHVVIEAPEDHTTVVAVLSGALLFEPGVEVRDAEAALLSRSGNGASLISTAPTNALVLTGAPIKDPLVGRGPFIMNSEVELRQALRTLPAGGWVRQNCRDSPIQLDRAQHWLASNLISGYAPSGGRP
jgi:quercetin 2,3-dioxygenase